MKREYVCTDCGSPMLVSLRRWTCDACGGAVDLRFLDPDPFPGPRVGRGAVRWPSEAVLPCPRWALDRAWLGESPTPLVQANSGRRVWLKCDHLMPTGSFKDRGALVLTALALELGASKIVIDSSGNAGAAVAAHAARAGLPCQVFVPAGTSSRKVRQAQRYGAEVVSVPGDRTQTEAAAHAAAQGDGVFYAGHAANPHFHHGVKTWAYEVREQLGRAPGTVVVPVGSGSLLLGMAIGFQELLADGSIDRVPRLVAVQSASCAPMASKPTPSSPALSRLGHPVAEGIAVREPIRLRQLMRTVSESGGNVVVVEDEQIVRARDELALDGFYVEPTGAVAWAAMAEVLTQGTDGDVVFALTGSGLKSDEPSQTCGSEYRERMS